MDKGSLGMAHCRLAIIDLKPESNQPFISSDKKIIMVYNGEIFNYIELRKELENLGYHFKTKSDTEVLLSAYRQWGYDVCGHLNGMWSFAIYDMNKDILFCSRDRFGIKPFYYAITDGKILFASEVKALLSASRSLAKLNIVAISKFLKAGILANTNDHFCLGVHRLPAAHNMIIEREKEPSLNRYWDYPDKIEKTLSFDDASENFLNLLKDSIKIRMRSDVKVGTTLSGGIDSSSIVCLLRTFYQGEHHSFTAKFKESAYDESVMASRLANKIGVDHHKISALPLDFLDTLDKIAHHLDGPTSSPAIFPLWNIMKSMRKKNIPVALEGQGADELLGGYYGRCVPVAIVDSILNKEFKQSSLHIKHILFSEKNNFYNTTRMMLELIRSCFPNAHKLFRLWRGDEWAYGDLVFNETDKHPDRINAPISPEHLNNELRRQHEGTLATLLQYGDAISMAHSVESRLPFMDHRLVDFAFGLPGSFKLRNGQGKVLLRHAVRKYVPREILNNRIKLGFVVPIREWFRKQPNDLVYPILLDSACLGRGIFHANSLKKVLKNHISGKIDISAQIFRWIMLELWCRNVFD